MLALALLVGISLCANISYSQIQNLNNISNINKNFDNDIVHPKYPTAWGTRKLFMTHNINYEKLIECQKELEALTKEAINEEMLITMQNILIASITQQPKLFHWCFYYEMMKLDLKLDDINLNKSYIEKYSFFIEQMKKLWILARALDLFFDTKKYFGYLRARYIQISEDHFGKFLKPIAPPLGDEKIFFENLPKKPAGLNFSEY